MSDLLQYTIKKDGEYQKELIECIESKNKEIERLNSIIKEVREYMNKHEIEEVYLDCKLYETKVYKDILEMLDKVDKENNNE